MLSKLSHVRRVFTDRLSLQKAKGVTVLSDWSFDLLTDMVKAVLSEANKTADFRSPAILMPLSAAYYRVVSGLPEFLQSQLKDLDIWKNSHFWEASFFESVEQERKPLPDYIQDGRMEWALLTPTEQKEVMEMEENVI